MIREIGYELLRMSSQKKNYIPIAGYLFFIGLCYIACRTSAKVIAGHISTFGIPPEEAIKYLDGLCFARIVLIPTFIVLMPLVMATLGGDCVAGEMQEGSLALYMTRSRSRTFVILQKFAAIYIAGFIYSIFFACASIIIGIILFGLAPTQIMLLSGRTFGDNMAIMSNGESLVRYAMAVLYFSFSLMTLGSMALFFSTVFNRMSSAAIAVLTFYFVSYVVSSLPYAAALRPWLISEIMNNVFLFYMSPIPLGKLVINLASLALYITSFLMASIIHFNYKDIR